MDTANIFKVAVIAFLMTAISILHHVPISGFLGTHILHRELFFFPIVLAGLWFSLNIALCTAIVASVVYAHFFYRHNIGTHSVSMALIGLQVSGFNLMALLTGWMVSRQRRQRRERDFLNETFGKYVSREVRDEILAGRVSLKGELKTVTVLFADLRNFTQLVETIPPRDVVIIINTYFQAMSEAIAKHRGLVVQYIGDEIEAVFGAPVTLERHHQCALDAALEMRQRLSQVNLRLANQGYPCLRHGIGIHSGKVVAANIGSSMRLSYALVGETVNLASRIQGLNKTLGTDILISDAVYRRLDRSVKATRMAPVDVQGVSEALNLYRIQ